MYAIATDPALKKRPCPRKGKEVSEHVCAALDCSECRPRVAPHNIDRVLERLRCAGICDEEIKAAASRVDTVAELDLIRTSLLNVKRRIEG